MRIYIFHPASGKVDSILFHYPDQQSFPPPKAQQNYDMEGFFWHNNMLHLFSKNKVGKGNYFTKHYRLPAQPGEYTATLLDSISLKDRVVTAAAISPDGKTVALLAYNYKILRFFLPKTPASVFLFTDFDGDGFLKGKMRRKKAPKFLLPTQYESLDFLDNQKIYIASERTKFIPQRARCLRIP